MILNIPETKQKEIKLLIEKYFANIPKNLRKEMSKNIIDDLTNPENTDQLYYEDKTITCLVSETIDDVIYDKEYEYNSLEDEYGYTDDDKYTDFDEIFELRKCVDDLTEEIVKIIES